MLFRSVALVLLTVGALAGCTARGDDETLPAARPLAGAAADALADLGSVRFQLKVTGVVPGIAVREVTGVARTEGAGSAQGDADVQWPDERIQYEFALSGKEVALDDGDQLSTVDLPARLTPVRLLDDEHGLGLLLDRAARLRTETREEVDGVSAYRIDGVLRREAIATVVPGIHADVAVKFWVAEGGKRNLVRLWIQVPPRKENEGAAMLELGLSDHKTAAQQS